jgi:hypothetical protein
MRVVRREVVHVVVARQVVPRDSDEGHRSIERFEQRKVVSHQIAQRDSERRIDTDDFLDDIVRERVDLFGGVGLGVAEEEYVEGVGFGYARQWEINGVGQGAGRLDAGEVQVRRGPLGFVDVVTTCIR